jgi:hypothetical protein
MPSLNEVVQIAGYFGLAAAAIVYLKSNVQKSKSNESLALAELRGERIDDLEKHIARIETDMAAQKAEMLKQIAHLQGQVDAVRGLKTAEIIDGVLVGLKPFLDVT